jgi:hypothetical protein
MASASTDPAVSRPSPLDWTFRVLGFVVLVASAFAMPGFPSTELDASWRMALGKLFVEGKQFGTEVVFTYGPLGWVMGKTYWGGQWASLLAWHATLSVIFVVVLYRLGFQLQGYRRLFFFAYFFLFGLSYQDAMHQIIAVMVGLELIQRSDKEWRWSTLAWIALLAVLALVKFTNLVLCIALVGLAGGLDLWLRRRWTSVRIPLLFAGAFVVGWMLCGQNPLNLPAYFRSSWEISEGYQDAMGFPCPTYQLVIGLVTALLMLTYLAINLATHPNRIRGTALTLGAGAVLYLNWKHGYIRADGHQVGFYYVVLAVVVSAPLLLEDGPRFMKLKTTLLTLTAFLSLVGSEFVLPGLTRGALGNTQMKVDQNIAFALGQINSRKLYDLRVMSEEAAADLLRTKAIVKDASIDVLGFEQGIVIVNHLNYQPRPIFQSYSAYTPYLARLNFDYYASDQAPEFVLFKLQSIDNRLMTMDDAQVLRLLVQRYTYIVNDQGFTLWQRKPGPFDPATIAPKLLRTVTIKRGEKLKLTDLAEDQVLWAEVEYQPTLVGRLRRFLFRPPLVQLSLTDSQQSETVYRLPQPIGRAGFIVSPIIDNMLEYMRSAGGTPLRRLGTLSVDVAPGEPAFIQDDIKVSIYALPPSNAGQSFFKDADKLKFNMFVDTPVSYNAFNPPNEDQIDQRKVMIMHAPSEMVFDVPAGATTFNGSYGFVPGAYSNGGKTNGAEFVISWSDGNDPIILEERYLSPVTKSKDRGLQSFSLRLPKGTGKIFCRINPGPFGEYAFDWTGWTAIEFK